MSKDIDSMFKINRSEEFQELGKLVGGAILKEYAFYVGFDGHANPNAGDIGDYVEIGFALARSPAPIWAMYFGDFSAVRYYFVGTFDQIKKKLLTAHLEKEKKKNDPKKKLQKDLKTLSRKIDSESRAEQSFDSKSNVALDAAGNEWGRYEGDFPSTWEK